MELLISKSDVEKYFQVAIGRSDKEFNHFIQQAQLFDLKELLPERFLNDVLATPEDYSDLINGGSYEYEEHTYQHEGLKGVLAHFVYGTYLFKGNITDTSYGMVTKKTPHSDPVEYKERRDWYYQHRKQANILFEDVKKYLDRNRETYTIWDECTTRPKRRFKTTIIQ